MKKEGIQTRNRKLSSKGKKKKGILAIPEGINPLDPSKSFCSFAPSHGQLSSAMSSMSAMSAVNHYVHGASNMSLSMGGSPFMSSHSSMHMGPNPHHPKHGLSLSLQASGQILPMSATGLGISSTNSLSLIHI